MPWGVAVAAVGAYASDRAASKAAKSTEKGIDVSANLARQARSDAIRLFETAAADGRRGVTGAFDFYRQNAAKRYQPFIGGNMAAQNVIGQGAQQANNAILGLPVDMSFTQAQSVNPDLSFLQNAQMPMLGAELAQGPMPSPEQQSNTGQPPPQIISQPVIYGGHPVYDAYGNPRT